MGVYVEPSKRHNFVWAGACWKCTKCHREKRQSRSRFDRLPCGSMSISVQRMLSEGHDFGHKLSATQGVDTGNLVIFCNVCAAMVSTRAVNLLKPCGRPTSGWQKTALARFTKLLHPKTGESLMAPWPYLPTVRLGPPLEPLPELEEWVEPSGACGSSDPVGTPSGGSSDSDDNNNSERL